MSIPLYKKKAIEQIKRHQSIVNNALNTVVGPSNSINGGGSVISNKNYSDDFEIPFEVKNER